MNTLRNTFSIKGNCKLQFLPSPLNDSHNPLNCFFGAAGAEGYMDKSFYKR